MANGFCDIWDIMESYLYHSSGKIFENYMIALENIRMENRDDNFRKAQLKSLCVSQLGKLLSNPTKAEYTLCDSFERLNDVVSSKKPLSFIEINDDLIQVYKDKKASNKTDRRFNVILGAYIWSYARIHMMEKIIQIQSKFLILLLLHSTPTALYKIEKAKKANLIR